MAPELKEEYHIDFAKMDGLIPVVIQDHENNEVLMVGFMNEDAWRLTRDTGKVHYYSRKKRRLWMKGEQSGHFQFVKEVLMDNDCDTLLIKVNQVGGAVEDGYRSCFYLKRADDGWVRTGARIFDPSQVYDRYSEQILFALPSGSLYATTVMLMTLAGFQLELRGERSFKPTVRNHKNLTLVVAHSQDIPQMVQDGEVDIGIVGIDLVEESQANVTTLGDLGYNEAGRGEVSWVIAIPREHCQDYQRLDDFSGKVVRTELPNTVGQFFTNRKIGVRIKESTGTTEGHAPVLCDAVVDLCETGRSLTDNGLCPVASIRTSTAHLFANNESMGYGWKRRQIAAIRDSLLNACATLPANPKKMVSLPPHGELDQTLHVCA